MNELPQARNWAAFCGSWKKPDARWSRPRVFRAFGGACWSSVECEYSKAASFQSPARLTKTDEMLTLLCTSLQSLFRNCRAVCILLERGWLAFWIDMSLCHYLKIKVKIDNFSFLTTQIFVKFLKKLFFLFFIVRFQTIL